MVYEDSKKSLQRKPLVLKKKKKVENLNLGIKIKEQFR